MKLKARPDACPVLLPSKPEVERIRAAWVVFEEMAFKGRRGASIGSDQYAYSGDCLNDLSELIRGILIACDNGISERSAASQQQAAVSQQEPIIAEHPPSDGYSGYKATPGTLWFDKTKGAWYIQRGTAESPVWDRR